MGEQVNDEQNETPGVVAKLGGTALEWVRDAVVDRDEQMVADAIARERMAECDRAARVLDDLELPQVKVVALLVEEWGMDRGDAELLVLEDRRVRRPARRFTEWMMGEGYSRPEVRRWMAIHRLLPRFRNDPELFQLTPAKLKARVEAMDRR